MSPMLETTLFSSEGHVYMKFENIGFTLYASIDKEWIY